MFILEKQAHTKIHNPIAISYSYTTVTVTVTATVVPTPTYCIRIS